MRLFDWTHSVDLRQELHEIYLHRFLFQLAVNTVAIFLPLYVYEQAGSTAPVFVFFAAFYAVFIMLVWPAAKLTARIGYKHASLLSSPFILAFYLVLRSSTSIELTYAAALLGGIGFITYWMGMNSEMARNSHSNHRSREAGIFFSMPKVAAILSPLFGGMILSVFGFEVLFGAATALVAVSYLPFLFSGEHFSGMDAEVRTVFNRRHATDFFTYFFRGITGLYGKVLWPLYVAVVIGGSLNIGGVGSIMSIGGVVAALIIGRIVTADNRGSIMILGGIITAATFIASAFIATPHTAFLISFINGVSFLAIAIPLYSAVMKNATREDIIEYVAFREIALCCGRVTYLLISVAVFTLLPSSTAFLTGFSLLAITAVLSGILAARMAV